MCKRKNTWIKCICEKIITQSHKILVRSWIQEQNYKNYTRYPYPLCSLTTFDLRWAKIIQFRTIQNIGNVSMKWARSNSHLNQAKYTHTIFISTKYLSPHSTCSVSAVSLLYVCLCFYLTMVHQKKNWRLFLTKPNLWKFSFFFYLYFEFS